MIDQDEPRRLFESPDAPADLRALLVQAHEDLPSPVERELLVRSALGRGSGVQAPAHGRGTGLRWVAKAARRSARLWSVAAVVGVGAGAWYVAGVAGWRGSSTGGPAPTHVTAPAVTSPVVMPVGTEPPAAGLPAHAPADSAEPPAAVLAEEPRVGAPDGTASSATPVAVRVRPTARPRGHRAVSSGPELGARAREMTAAAPGNVTAGAAPDPTPVRPAPGVAGPPEAAPSAPQARPGESSLGADEAGLLRSARRALARAPERALALTDEHLHRFPNGMLDQEREALAIEALIKLGRSEEARPRARAFAFSYPTSPHRARLERALRPSGADAAP